MQAKIAESKSVANQIVNAVISNTMAGKMDSTNKTTGTATDCDFLS
ncbi:MAG: hypothetical protein IJF63_02570 [Alistipes sp.]|nr:hypothetical protein [Alistipes sp.]